MGIPVPWCPFSRTCVLLIFVCTFFAMSLYYLTRASLINFVLVVNPLSHSKPYFLEVFRFDSLFFSRVMSTELSKPYLPESVQVWFSLFLLGHIYWRRILFFCLLWLHLLNAGCFYTIWVTSAHWRSLFLLCMCSWLREDQNKLFISILTVPRINALLYLIHGVFNFICRGKNRWHNIENVCGIFCCFKKKPFLEMVPLVKRTQNLSILVPCFH